MSLRSTTDSSNCSQVSGGDLESMNGFDDSAMYTQVLRIGAVEDIIEEMKCFICKSVAPPDATLVCREGHMVCLHCFNIFPNKGCCKDLDISGELCKAKVIKINLALYSFIYNNAFHSCKFEAMGCKKEILGYNIAMHSHNCKYRIELPCAFTLCQDTCSYIEYMDHIRSVHKVVEINANEGNVQVGLERANNGVRFNGKSYRWVCGIICALNSTFLLLAEEHMGGISMWLIQSPTDEGSDFEYSLNVLAAEDVIFSHSGRALTWEGHVQPFEGNLGNAFLNGECFTVSKQIFEKKYSYEVNRKVYWNLGFSISCPTPLSPTQDNLECHLDLPNQNLTDPDIIDLLSQNLPDTGAKNVPGNISTALSPVPNSDCLVELLNQKLAEDDTDLMTQDLPEVDVINDLQNLSLTPPPPCVNLDCPVELPCKNLANTDLMSQDLPDVAVMNDLQNLSLTPPPPCANLNCPVDLSSENLATADLINQDLPDVAVMNDLRSLSLTPPPPCVNMDCPVELPCENLANTDLMSEDLPDVTVMNDLENLSLAPPPPCANLDCPVELPCENLANADLMSQDLPDVAVMNDIENLSLTPPPPCVNLDCLVELPSEILANADLMNLSLPDINNICPTLSPTQVNLGCRVELPSPNLADAEIDIISQDLPDTGVMNELENTSVNDN